MNGWCSIRSRCHTLTSEPWWRHPKETFSALLAFCAGNSRVAGEFLTQRPVTRSFDVFFDLCQNKRLSKQWWGWWFETPSHPLWRHCNGISVVVLFCCVTILYKYSGKVLTIIVNTFPIKNMLCCVYSAETWSTSFNWLATAVKSMCSCMLETTTSFLISPHCLWQKLKIYHWGILVAQSWSGNIRKFNCEIRVRQIFWHLNND